MTVEKDIHVVLCFVDVISSLDAPSDTNLTWPLSGWRAGHPSTSQSKLSNKRKKCDWWTTSVSSGMCETSLSHMSMYVRSSVNEKKNHLHITSLNSWILNSSIVEMKWKYQQCFHYLMVWTHLTGWGRQMLSWLQDWFQLWHTLRLSNALTKPKDDDMKKA